MIRVVIADDHEIVRRGMKEILVDWLDEVEVHEAATAEALLDTVQTGEWHLVILDIVMPGPGVVEVIRRLKQLHPRVPVLILTAVMEDQYASQTLGAGADGYITKRYASDELINAVRALLRGDRYLSQEALRAVTGQLRGDAPQLPHDRLSPRERQVFLLLARGRTVKEAAADLNVSDKTIATYVIRIREKTGLSSYVEFARYAMLHHLDEPATATGDVG